MPEGPSIVILKELAKCFENQKVIAVTGNSKENIARANNQIVIAFKSWGKHLLICFEDFTIRIHLMLFGSYRINERRDTTPRLGLAFGNGELNFYACSVKIINEPLESFYDWTVDIMSESWNATAAKNKLEKKPQMLACDALLDQHIFSGSGNIIKNEVLFRIRVHPLSRIGKLPAKKLLELIKETHNYAFQFLEWKKANVLKKHWLAYTKTICPRCQIRFTKAHLGQMHRRSFFCTNCQELYD